MRLLTLIAVVSGLYAGPIGDYLGISRGTLWAYKEVKKDSSWGPLGISVTLDTIRDTARIIEEFIYQGDSAYLKEEISVNDAGAETLTDTLWEEGDSLIGHILGPLPIIGTLYKTPFEIGKSWRPSWDTLYLIDIDEDGEEDTLRMIEDLVRVLSQENISVPFGEIEGAYKLKRTVKVNGWVSFYGLGATFEAETYYFQWYKPELGAVRDSSYGIVSEYIGDSLVSRKYIWIEKELTYMSHEAGVRENRTIEYLHPFDVKVNPLHKAFSISFSLKERAYIKVSLYDILGREVGRMEHYYPRGEHTLKYNAGNLPQGIYFLKVYRNGKEIGRGKVIRVNLSEF